MSDIRGTASEDLDANIGGIWQDIDELNARLPGKPLVGLEEIQAVTAAWKELSFDDQYARLVALVFLVCARDKELLGTLYHLVELEYQPDGEDDD